MASFTSEHGYWLLYFNSVRYTMKKIVMGKRPNPGSNGKEI